MGRAPMIVLTDGEPTMSMDLAKALYAKMPDVFAKARRSSAVA